LTCSPACGTGRTCYATNVCAWTAGTIQNLQTALQNHQTEIVVLTADLNASSFSWHVPYFGGVLDGQGHTISNLTATDNPFIASAGMIGRGNFATIKNLKLTNLRSTGAWSAGGLVGDCDGCMIDSVAVEGTVNAPSYVGGVVGGMNAGTVTKTYFKGTVTGGDQAAGGLVGLAYDNGIDLATITNCYAQAVNQTSTLVAGNTTAGIHPAGGIVGAGAGNGQRRGELFLRWPQDVLRHQRQRQIGKQPRVQQQPFELRAGNRHDVRSRARRQAVRRPR
jgi:hypothetical protein